MVAVAVEEVAEVAVEEVAEVAAVAAAAAVGVNALLIRIQLVPRYCTVTMSLSVWSHSDI